MDFNQLKSLSHIPDEELTAKLVALGAQIIQHHDVGDGYGQFYWSDIEILPDGSLSIEGVKLVPLTDDVRWENYLDYAGAIYCICTQEKFAESMAADAPRKIKQPVLREIVMTICRQDDSIYPLIDRLRRPYIDYESFFQDFKTADDRNAEDEAARAERRQARWEAEDAAVSSKPISGITNWLRNKATYIFIALCILGYREYKSYNTQKKRAATEQIYRQREERKRQREYLRNRVQLNLPYTHKREKADSVQTPDK